MARQDDVLDLWLQPVDQVSSSWAQLNSTVLDEGEIERWRRYLSTDSQTLFVVAHVVTRYVLSEYGDRSPQEWQFDYGATGRPEIVGRPAGLRFNISHTNGMVAVLVHDEADCGVDIENRADPVDMPSVARKVFTDIEQAAIFALAPNEQADRFFHLWTLKEAFIKAKGKGFALPLKQFSFTIDENQPTKFACSRGIDDAPDQWQFFTHRPTAPHIVSVAADRSAHGEANPMVIRAENVVQRYG